MKNGRRSISRRVATCVTIFSLAQNAEAGLWDRLFPGRSGNDRVHFRNFQDRDYAGYCYGVSRVESQFSSKSRKDQFDPSAPRDSEATVERKMRAALNGDKVRFNGYRNLHDLSESNPRLMKGLVKEISLSQKGDYDEHIRDPKMLARGVDGAYSSAAKRSVVEDLKAGRPRAIGFCGDQKIARGDPRIVGEYPCHAVKALSARDAGGFFKVKVQDPNTGTTRTLEIAKGADGSFGRQGRYNEWSRMREQNVQIYSYDTDFDRRHPISRRNRFSADRPRTLASGSQYDRH